MKFMALTCHTTHHISGKQFKISYICQHLHEKYGISLSACFKILKVSDEETHMTTEIETINREHQSSTVLQAKSTAITI